ncbi:N-acetylmuramoyl-L-alanine amidase, partial [Aeromonas veronii]
MTQLASQPCFSIDAAGWCQQARRVPSPHHNERAAPDDISLLVVHGISLPPG